MLYLILHLWLGWTIAPDAQNNKIIYDHYKEGLEAAARENKPVFLLFTGYSCANDLAFNKMMLEEEIPHNNLLDSFVMIILYVDDPEPLAQQIRMEINGNPKILRTKGNLWAHLQISK